MDGQIREIIFSTEGRTWAQTGRRMNRTIITILTANITLCQALFPALPNFILTKPLQGRHYYSPNFTDEWNEKGE